MNAWKAPLALRRSLTLTLLWMTLLAGIARGQEAAATDPGPWKFRAVVGLNLAQSAYSSNWAGGDNGSIVWALTSDVTAERQINTRFNLANLLQLAYGQTAKQQVDPSDPNRTVWDRPEKTTDLILFESTGRFTLQAAVDPFVGIRVESQFLDQSDPRGKLDFNPVKLTETVGVARVIVKQEDREVISRIGAGFRQVFARAFTDPAGGTTESFTTNDGGIEWLLTATQPLFEKKVIYKGRVLVFAPLFFSNSDELEEFDRIAAMVDPLREPVADFWKSPDVNFQNTFSAEITKILSVNLYAQLVYDKFDSATNLDLSQNPAALIEAVDRGVRKAGQFKQTLALALNYTLF